MIWYYRIWYHSVRRRGPFPTYWDLTCNRAYLQCDIATFTKDKDKLLTKQTNHPQILHLSKYRSIDTLYNITRNNMQHMKNDYYVFRTWYSSIMLCASVCKWPAQRDKMSDLRWGQGLYLSPSDLNRLCTFIQSSAVIRVPFRNCLPFSDNNSTSTGTCTKGQIRTPTGQEKPVCVHNKGI